MTHFLLSSNVLKWYQIEELKRSPRLDMKKYFFTVAVFACACVCAEPSDTQGVTKHPSLTLLDNYENQISLPQQKNFTMSLSEEASIQPSRNPLFLVSYSNPHKVISAVIEMFCPKGQYSYACGNGKIHAVNMEKSSSKQLENFSSWRDYEHLSPLFEKGRISFIQPFIANVLDEVGFCYLMPSKMPKINEYSIQNLPPNTEVVRCTATLQNGKLLLKARNASAKKEYFVFFDPSTCLIEPKHYEITYSYEYMQPTGLVWKDNYIWELSVSKRKILEYVVYSISRQSIMQHGEVTLSDGEVPIVTAKGLYTMNVLTYQALEIYTIPKQENESPA